MTLSGSEFPPPAWMDEEAKVEWARLVPKLIATGMFTELDGAILACLCQSVAENRSMEEQIQREGRLVAGPNGRRSRNHPLLRPQLTIQRQILSFAREFGLRPASRRREPVEPHFAEEPRPLRPPRLRPDPDLDPIA